MRVLRIARVPRQRRRSGVFAIRDCVGNGWWALFRPEQIVPASQLECHYCGYTCPGEIPPRICPKCYGSAWERTPVPGSTLLHSIQFELPLRLPAARKRLMVAKRHIAHRRHHALA
jgi:hypothetical protein